MIALLTTLALQLPTLTGRRVPEMANLPTLDVAESLQQTVFAYTGQHSGGDLGIALYLPRENVILITSVLLTTC